MEAMTTDLPAAPLPTTPGTSPTTSGTPTGAGDSLLVRAATGRPGAYPPVWFMRQAGRSLPEYRALREGNSMLEACRTPELITEITLQPVRRHGVDAAIFFSDIVVPLVAIGVGIDIVTGVGPVVEQPFREAADLERLRPLDAGDVPYVDEAVRTLTAELGATPLIGFAGAPFTLASYLVEGGPSKDHARTKAFMHGRPDLWHALLERLAGIAREYLKVQIGAGASAVQLFDSWAGALSLADYEQFVLPHSRAVLQPLAGTVPIIHFGVGTGELLGAMRTAGADVVGVDWRVPLDEAARRIGPGAVVQGNLDPALLGADWDVVERETRRVVRAGPRRRRARLQPRPRSAAGRRPGCPHAHRRARPLPGLVTTRPRSLVVIGGGIAGLAAAWFAADAGLDVTVLEAASEVGGKLRTAEVAGVVVDVGAEAVLTTRPEALELIAAAGLDGDRIAPLTTAARIRTGGTDHALPARTLMGIPTDAAAARESGALTPQAVAAIDAEPDLDPLPPLADDIAVGALVRDRLGDEITDRLVDPLLGGVYSGRADGLSLRATLPALAARLTDGGSLVETARTLTGSGTRAPSAGSIFSTLRGGLGRLPQALATAGRFTVRTSVTVRSVTRTPTGFALECGAVPASERIEADAVVVAAPPAKAARLLRDIAPAAAAELGGIDSASMAITTFAFDGITPPGGSGLLVGSGERLAVKAVTLSSQKWPLDTGGLTLLRASVGRAGEPQALQMTDGDLLALVRRELRPLLGIDAEPVDAAVTRWGGGLPQYGVGHVERIARVRAAVEQVPGLAVCGAAYDGVGVPACIGSARRAADHIVTALSAVAAGTPERGE